MSVPLSRQHQQYLQQQQENYFSTGLATPPPPASGVGLGVIGSPLHPSGSSSYLSSPAGASVGMGSGADFSQRTPVRQYYDSFSHSSAYSPTFLPSPAHSFVGPQMQQHETSINNVRAQVNGYWSTPLSPGAGAGASFVGAGNPSARSHLHYEDYYPGSRSHSPSGSYSFGRKSDGFEPMNTSPTVQQHQQQHWQYSPSPPRAFSFGMSLSPGHSHMAPAPSGYAPGTGSVTMPVQMMSSSPYQHQHHYFSFFGNEPDTPPPPGPPIGMGLGMTRSTSLKDLTYGVGAGDLSSAAAAFHRSKQLFETPPKAGLGTGGDGACAKSGPPVFGLGNYESEGEDGPRILRHASSSPNLLLDKRRAGAAAGEGSSGSGGKKPRQFGPSPSGSISSLNKSASAPVTPQSPASSSRSGSSAVTGANSPTLSNWVTVFGFSAAATSYIISHFGQFGTVLETKCVPGSNWIHIKYSNKFEARKALNKNGAVIGGSMMVGVMPYDPEAAAAGDDGLNAIGAASAAKPSSTSVHIQPQPVTGAGSSSAAGTVDGAAVKAKEVKSRLRPLAHTGYLGTNPLPKENNGIVSRALEFLFGW